MDMQARLDDAQAKLEAEKKAFEPKATTADDRAKAENFQKMMTLYDELKTKQVKDLFMDGQKESWWLRTCGDGFCACGEDHREFKTEAERKFLNGVLERIRVNGTSCATRPLRTAMLPRPHRDLSQGTYAIASDHAVPFGHERVSVCDDENFRGGATRFENGFQSTAV